MIREIERSGPYRISPKDKDESLLIESAVQGRALAAERISALLAGFQLDKMDVSADDATMALLEVDQVLLDHFRIEEAVDRDLLTADLAAPRLRLLGGNAGAKSAESLGVVDRPMQAGDPTSVLPVRAIDRVTAGSTIVLNNIGTRSVGPLRRFANDLSRVTNTRAQLNAYLSERDAQGFGRHWDDHDVLILQVRGRKQWSVFAPAALSPVVGYVDAQQFGEPVFTTVIEPGMGLFLPRGWGHQVRGFGGELSVHLTCGMRRMAGLDLIRGWCDVDNARDRVLPSLSFEGLRSFSELDTSGAAVEDAYGDWRSRSKPLVENGLIDFWSARQRLAEGWTIRSIATAAPVFIDADGLQTYSEVGISAARSCFALPRGWVGAWAALLKGHPLLLADLLELVPGASSDEMERWVWELGGRSLVAFDPPKQDSRL